MIAEIQMTSLSSTSSLLKLPIAIVKDAFLSSLKPWTTIETLESFRF